MHFELCTADGVNNAPAGSQESSFEGFPADSHDDTTLTVTLFVKTKLK